MLGERRGGRVTECPHDECVCEDWPPDECPRCGVQTLGFTPEDWWEHFGGECHGLARLFCFAVEPETA